MRYQKQYDGKCRKCSAPTTWKGNHVEMCDACLPLAKAEHEEDLAACAQKLQAAAAVAAKDPSAIPALVTLAFAWDTLKMEGLFFK